MNDTTTNVNPVGRRLLSHYPNTDRCSVCAVIRILHHVLRIIVLQNETIDVEDR